MILPCKGHEALYDIVLFDDSNTAERQQATHRAAALCATCPMQCDQMVTAGSKPAPLVLLEADWTPPEHRVAAVPSRRKASGGRRPRKPRIGVDFEHFRRDQRIAVWARMAAERDDAGLPLSAIAVELCVSVETAARLLEMGRTVRAA
ncbi:hypothetical protein [Streptomyces africanus]|uniref:hypothetical protein n=1 Tax=Streptomyces africanus TaxID=231024 RepID=UPI000A38BA86|nr:hypothetical protein [Streptomyces africanus]